MLAVIALVFGASGGCFFRGRLAKQQVKTEQTAAQVHHDNWQSERDANQKKGEEILGLKVDLNGVKQERDSAKDRLVKWEALAATLNPDDPPSKRLDLLFEQLQSMTNILQYLDPSKVTLDLYVNDQEITNDLPILLPHDGQIRIKVKNRGELTAENVTVMFLANLAQTNLLAEHWQIRGGTPPAGGDDLGWGNWLVKADFLVGSDMSFGAPLLTVSTNHGIRPVIAKITTYANRTRSNTRMLLLVPIPTKPDSNVSEKK